MSMNDRVQVTARPLSGSGRSMSVTVTDAAPKLVIKTLIDAGLNVLAKRKDSHARRYKRSVERAGKP